jgi:hypothetical protein
MQLRLLHVLGAAAGGAIAGGAIGFVGATLTLSSWRPWVIGATALAAIMLSVKRRRVTLGLQCQVPRTWNRTMPPHRRYFLWGALLGSGCATLIPYSTYLLLVGAQLTAGVLLGTLSGVVFGATRQGVALILPLVRTNHEAVMDLLPTFHEPARRLNAVVAIGGGVFLVLATWT